MVAPDIVIYREPLSDEELNTPVILIDDTVALKTDITGKKWWPSYSTCVNICKMDDEK